MNKIKQDKFVFFKTICIFAAMNIELFVKSLSDTERLQLKKYFSETIESQLTTREFIGKNSISARLTNILHENSAKGEVFEYVSQINKAQFFRLPGAGQRSWEELEKLLKK